MEWTGIKSLDKIHGITLGGPETQLDVVLDSLRAQLEVATDLLRRGRDARGLSPMADAASATLHSVAALMRAAEPLCNLAPPPGEIEVRVAENGNLIYRCHHIPPHEWDMTGRLIR